MFRNILAAIILSLAVTQVGFAEETPIDVNTATVEQLADALYGVGMAKARAIVEYREQHGDFEHADELVNVRGIGLRTLDRNRDRIDLDEGPTGD
ncbi:MAG: ComEA family DNA-binding protein [Wenzhouxiangella sp.]